MYQDLQPAGLLALRHDRLLVPFQPNVNADGTANPLAGKDDAIFDGATDRDPGGLPLGSTEYLELSDFFVAPGAPFKVTRAPALGQGHAPAADTVTLARAGGLDGRRRDEAGPRP